MKKEEINSLLGEDAFFEGKVAFKGTVRIDGTLKGEINSDGTLVIGERGKIEGTIKVGVLIVHGCVEGECEARERVELRRGANFTGNIKTPSFVVEDGVIFNGTCTMEKRREIPGEKG